MYILLLIAIVNIDMISDKLFTHQPFLSSARYSIFNIIHE